MSETFSLYFKYFRYGLLSVVLSYIFFNVVCYISKQILVRLYWYFNFNINKIISKIYLLNKIAINTDQSKHDAFYCPKKDLSGHTNDLNQSFYYNKKPDILFLGDKYVLYLEDGYHENYNQFITNNYYSICELFQSKGYEFVYLPKFLNEIKPSKDIAFLKFKHPLLHNFTDAEIENLYVSELQKTTISDMYQILIKGMNLQFLEKPIYFSNIYPKDSLESFFSEYLHRLHVSKHNFNCFEVDYKFYEPYYYNYGFTELKCKTEAEFKIDISHLAKKRLTDRLMIFNILQKKVPPCNKLLESKNIPENETYADYNADNDHNYNECRDVYVAEKMDDFFLKDQSYWVADAIFYKIFKLNTEKPALFSVLSPIIERQKSIKIVHDFYLSQIYINKYFNILLTDYGNIEIKMDDLSKTVYLFILMNPKGIIIGELSNYRHELLELYQKICFDLSAAQMKKDIDDLVNINNNLINHKLKRSEEAIMQIMDVEHSKYYVISGNQLTPRKIILPKSLIVFET